jgi:hypothetical protein
MVRGYLKMRTAGAQGSRIYFTEPQAATDGGLRGDNVFLLIFAKKMRRGLLRGNWPRLLERCLSPLRYLWIMPKCLKASCMSVLLSSGHGFVRESADIRFGAGFTGSPDNSFMWAIQHDFTECPL